MANLRNFVFLWRRGILSLLVFGLAFSFAFGQGRTVKGKVSSAAEGALPGVNVVIQGTTVGTMTDASGNFSIAVPGPEAVLVFSFISYTTQTVTVGAQTSIDVVLAPAMSALTEVVVVGYGTQKKREVTSAITSVKSDEFVKGSVSDPVQLIQGKVSGLSISKAGGDPNGGFEIRLRGMSTIGSNLGPLIVIDGVPVSNDGIPGSPNALSLINPNDIASFTILKDASATAIYGSRASNGVIIITTKTGRAGAEPRFNFNTTFSASYIDRGVNVLSPNNFRKVVNEYGTAEDISRLGTANTDWQKVIYHTALTTDNNLSVSGGLKNMPYRISAGYMNQQGVLKTGKLDRYSGAVNVSPSLFDDHLKINVNLKGSITKSRFANTGAISGAVYFDPTKPVYSDNSKYNGYWEWVDPDPTNAKGLRGLAPLNPLGLLMDRHDMSTVKRSIGNVLLDYKVHFLPDLHAFLNVGYDYALGEGTIKVDPNAAQDYLRSPDAKHGGRDNQYKQDRKDRLLEAYLNYTKNIQSIDTRVDVVGGYAYQDFLTINHNYPDLTTDGFVITTPTFAVDSPRYTLISYYGRANINIKDRYLLTGTIRTDGSSRFAEDQRWGVFPSGAFAWNIKNEGFLANSKSVSTLKLRVGYGLTGQQSGIGLYDYNSFYGYSSNESQYQFGDAFYHMYAPGGYYPQRTWEKTATSNLGLDFGFADNRISGSVDVYYKKTTDLLNEVNQPAGSNFSNKIVANVGSMENKGIEVQLNLQPVKNSSVVWDLSLNGTYNENKITKLDVVNNPDYAGNRFYGISGGTGNTILINSVDYPRGSFYVYKQVYDSKGLPIDGLLDDINRDGVINENDLYRYKKGDPDYFLGASTNINIHKHLNLGFVMRASIGNYVFNNNISASSQITNMIQTSKKFLTNGIAYNLVQGGSDKSFLSDYYIQNGSFVKMDNLYISYTFNKLFSNKTNLTLNANMQNVFTITNYIGLDPEVQSGIDNNIYPRPRIISLGANINF